MFSDSDEKFLLRAFGKNQVVLFTGAGFSCEAENQRGEKLPVGKALSKRIWDFLKYDGDYDDTSLPDMFQALMSKKLPYKTIQYFLEEIFLCNSIPDEYSYLTVPYWRRIYTTNIDNLISETFKRESKKLDILTFPKQDIRERDQFLNSTQLIHLNGRLPCPPNELTFSFEQFAEASSKKQPLYEEFVRDYCTNSTIFIGSEINEPIFWQCLASRKERFRDSQELRPKSFLIAPYISPAKKDSLDDFNIIPIEADTLQFLSWIKEKSEYFSDRKTILQEISPTRTSIVENFSLDSSTRASLEAFSSAFTQVNVNRPASRNRSLYLLGAAPSWEDIYLDLDAPRKFTNSIQNEIEDLLEKNGSLTIFAALGSAGCGKSTIVRRLGVNLARSGRLVFLTNSESLPSIDKIKKSLEIIDRKSVLIFDNAEVSLSYLPILANELKETDKPPIIVIASRTNDFDRICGRFRDDITILEREIKGLDRDEIISVIETLENNNLLGVLRGKTRDEQIGLFSDVAQNQILVAMREATSGKGFDEIIEDEFKSLVPHESQILYLCTALATEAGYRITKQQFVGCSKVTPAESLSILNRNLKDIIVFSGENGEHLLLRHRLIAQYAIESLVSRDFLAEAYTRVLNMLAINISNSKKHSRDIKLYRDLINHKTVYERFSNDIASARNIYENISSMLKHDPQFWLQYGSLEIEGLGGDLQYAENYLNQAESLDPNNAYITNAKGHLLLKKSINAETLEKALFLRKSGSDILEKNIKYSNYKDSYSVHILCTQKYNFLRHWYYGQDDIMRKELEELVNICRQGRAANPRHGRLKYLCSQLEQTYLELALPIEERKKIII